jgi:D-alanine-D-alanine ligase
VSMRVAVVHDALGEAARADEVDVLDQVRLVSDALAAAGHEVVRLEADLDLAGFARQLRQAAPALVFNLVEALGGSARLIHVLPALLEEIGIPFTGSGSEALFVTSNKLLAKRLLRSADLPTPDWVDEPSASALGETSRRWIVKPVWEDASVGIDDSAVVEGGAAQVLAGRRPNAKGPLFAEAFIEGREFNLSLLATGTGVDVLPPAEIDFSALAPGQPHIVGYAAKWLPDSFEYANTPRRFDFGAGDRRLLGRLRELALECWELFGSEGYARVDFRVDAAGMPWILEMNANPCLSPDAGFLAAAGRAGLDADKVVLRIAQAAFSSRS